MTKKGGIIMKKIVFLLLLAQTLSFLYADSGCRAYPWRWGRKPIESTQCYCNCEQYAQAHGKCIGCGHIHVPKNIKVNA